MHGLSTDLAKAFDRVPRQLLYSLLLLGGVPCSIVSAYARYHEQVLYYNSFAGQPGAPYARKYSIPQGCPLSMAFMTFILRPWVALIQGMGMGLLPRVLADDTMLLAPTSHTQQARCSRARAQP